MSESLSDGVVKPRGIGSMKAGSGGESREATQDERKSTTRQHMPIEALDASTPDPVSPTENETDIEELEKEISEITELEKKVHKLEEEK